MNRVVKLVPAVVLLILPACGDLGAQEVPAMENAHEHALELVIAGDRSGALRYLRDRDGVLPLSDTPLLLLYGTLEREAGELEIAETVFERALVAPDPAARATAWNEVAVTRSWSGDLVGAEEAYRAALWAETSFRPAKVGLARVLRWRGQLEEARALYLELLEDDGDPVDAMVGLGFVSLERLDGDQAAAWFRKALETSPANTEAREGLERISDARRLTVQWSVARADAVGARPEWSANASYRLTPRSTVTASVNLAPRVEDIVGSDPNAQATTLIGWTASAGLSRRMSTTWSGSARVERINSAGGGGYLGTLASGGRLGESWALNAGVRAGTLPNIGSDVMAWSGVTRIWSGGRSAGVTGFYGSDLRGTWSRSVLVNGSVGIGDRTSITMGAVRGWTSTVGFRQFVLGGRVRVGGGHELFTEVSRFEGGFQRTAMRAGAKFGL